MTKSDPIYQPTSVTAPGATLADLLEERGMSQVELARRMGRPEKTISEIIHGKAAITPETALQLESVFAVPARFWVAREADYRASLARTLLNRTFSRYVEWARKFPLREMKKRGWIDPGPDPGDQVREILSYFSIASPKQWSDCTRDYHTAYRAHQAFAIDEFALKTWLQAGRLTCERRHVQEFDAEMFRRALDEVRGLTRLDPAEAMPRASALLESAGVVLAIVPELPGCRVSGATQWVGSRRAVIQLSLRYRSDDHLWFTLFHEAGHILLHPRGEVIVESKEAGGDSPREREADEWAREFLVPTTEWSRFLESEVLTGRSIQEFSESQGISPGIVVGRLQHEKRIAFSAFNGLKRRLDLGALSAADAGTRPASRPSGPPPSRSSSSRSS